MLLHAVLARLTSKSLKYLLGKHKKDTSLTWMKLWYLGMEKYIQVEFSFSPNYGHNSLVQKTVIMEENGGISPFYLMQKKEVPLACENHKTAILSL